MFNDPREIQKDKCLVVEDIGRSLADLERAAAAYEIESRLYCIAALAQAAAEKIHRLNHPACPAVHLPD